MKRALLALLVLLLAGGGFLWSRNRVVETGTAGENDSPGEFAWLDPILGEAVEDGRVDYGLLARRRQEIQEGLAALEEVDLSGLPREERLAFWINAYNAHVLLGVLEGLRPARVADRGRLFFVRRIRVAGRTMTLDALEKHLRRTFREPRLHFALNCASASCPALRSQAYRGETLEEVLEEQARTFLAHPEKNRLDREEGVLYLSRIFQWYGPDFAPDQAGLVDYLLPYLPEADRAWLRDHPARVEYLPYDWSLNGSFQPGLAPPLGEGPQP